VVSDLEVPAREVATMGLSDAARAQTADRDPGVRPVIGHRATDARMAGFRAGEPDGAPPGDGRDDGRRDGLLHFSTPVTTTPRMNARWAMKKMNTGTAIASTAEAWMSVGWLA